MGVVDTVGGCYVVPVLALCSASAGPAAVGLVTRHRSPAVTTRVCAHWCAWGHPGLLV